MGRTYKEMDNKKTKKYKRIKKKRVETISSKHLYIDSKSDMSYSNNTD